MLLQFAGLLVPKIRLASSRPPAQLPQYTPIPTVKADFRGVPPIPGTFSHQETETAGCVILSCLGQEGK